MRNLLQKRGVRPEQGRTAPATLKARGESSPERVPAFLYYGLLVALVFEYVRPGTYVPAFNALKMNTIIPVSVFVFTLFSFRKINSVFLREPNTKWLAFFLVLIAGSILTADVTFYSWFRFKQLLGYYIFFFIIFKVIDDKERMKGIFLVLMLIHIVLAFLNPDLILKPETRPYIENVTFLGDGNDFGLSVSITIPFAIFLIQESNGVMKKTVFTLMLVILVLCVIGTSSRGASIALASVMLYQWIKSKKKLIGIALLLLLGVAVLVYAPDSYFERMGSIKNYETEGSAKGRLMAWGSAVRMATDNPLMGVGAGHFPVKYGTEYRPPGIGRSDIPWQTAHSIYFLILGELGVPGIIFLLSIILSNFFLNERRLKRLGGDSAEQISQRRMIVCLNSSLIAFSVAGAFLSAIYYPHLYIITGLFAAYGFHMAVQVPQPQPLGTRRLKRA